MATETTILCMDDDAAIRAMMHRFFSTHGYGVHIAADGEEGLALFRRQRPDIVLVDLMMPKVDGFAVLEALVAEAPEVPVIVVSGEGRRDDVIRALRLGAWDYHTKPISSYSLLFHAVEQALDRARLQREVARYRQGLERKFGVLVEQFPGFILTCDAQRRITFMNPALTAHIGPEALGEPVCRAVFGLEPGSACPGDETGEVARFDTFSVRDNRWYHVVQLPVAAEGAKGEYMLILYDITSKKKAITELEEQSQRLLQENRTLRAAMDDRLNFGEIIGRSAPMQAVYDSIMNAAMCDAGVIIYGESGTGKELVARAIHETSARRDHEMVYVNCGAIPEALIESEFFGYRKGAFTGATTDKRGFLDLADGGTLFLDEVGEIPLAMQVKLLRAIEGGGYTPVGGGGIRRPDVRVIAATNRDLAAMVRQGMMRQDFFFRIQVIPIQLPPLRERREDIPLLVEHFLARHRGQRPPAVTREVMGALVAHDWPGNVRELQNTIQRFMALGSLDFMDLDLAPAVPSPWEDIGIDPARMSMNEIVAAVERSVLEQTLARFAGHRGKTAKALDMAPKTLYRKLKLYGLDAA